MRFLLLRLSFLGFLLSAAFALAGSNAALDSAIRQRLQGFKGDVSVYAKNLDTGATYSLGGEQPVRTASTIKLPIMVECFAEREAGKLDLSEKLALRKSEKVSGSGLLQEFTDGLQIPLRDVIDLMIVISDNTATNMVIERIGANSVNARMSAFGLQNTRLMRKVRGDGNELASPSGFSDEGRKPENERWGLGRTSPREMVFLLEKLDRGELVSAEASREMLDILKRQRDHNGIARDMKDITVANKSGALDALRSDVGIVYSKRGKIAMAITVDNMPEINWTPENPGELMISAISEMLIDGL